MNFFEHQRQARKESGLLLVLFFLAVISILVAVNAAVWAGFEIYQSTQVRESYYDRYETSYSGLPGSSPLGTDELVMLVGLTTGVTLLIILLGSLFKTAQLRSGQGASVARLVGARRIEGNPTDLAEKRLLNVVEEMAIASGSNVPSVWVMDDEKGINAFAAGYVPSEATIVVSRGCMTELSREELQGVIAHEFSHIFNGDMRTNIRMLGVLHGILVIGLTGYGVMRVMSHASARRSSKRDSSAGAVLLAVLVVSTLLIVIGYMGVFFGRMIKATLSRSREYLADASAVQFTRNPLGIAGALAKIQAGMGSGIGSKNAEQFSHFYFADGIGFSAPFFATHPPLPERLNRILPGWERKLSASTRAPQPVSANSPESTQSRESRSRGQAAELNKQFMGTIGTSGVAQIAYAAEFLGAVPDDIHTMSASVEGARVILLLLLHVEHPSIPPTLSALVPNNFSRELLADVHSRLRQLGESKWLAVANLCMPGLQQLNSYQRPTFIKTCEELVAADGKTSAFETAILALLERSLAPSSAKRRAKFTRLEQVKPQLISVVALLAREGADDPALQYSAFQRGLEKAKVAGYVPERLPEVARESLPRLLEPLSQASPEVKETVLKALVEVSFADGTRTARETELLRTVAGVLECPIPPIT